MRPSTSRKPPFSPNAHQSWLPITIIMLVLLTLLGTEYTSAHKQQAMASSVQLPVAGQLYCIPSSSTCEHILPAIDNYTFSEQGQQFNVTMMKTQEWQANTQLSYPIAGRVGPLGVHHALGNISTYDSICKANSQLCQKDLTTGAQAIKNILNNLDSCMGQTTPITANSSQQQFSTLPLAYHRSSTKNLLIVLAVSVLLEYAIGAVSTFIAQIPTNRVYITSFAQGVSYVITGLYYLIIGQVSTNAFRQFQADGGWANLRQTIDGALMTFLFYGTTFFASAPEWCRTKALAAAAQILCPYPFPQAQAQAEAQTCYPGEQRFSNTV